MPEVSIDLNMVRVTNDDFVKKAEACAPKLQETVVKPVSIVDVVKTENIYPDVVVKDSIENLSSYRGQAVPGLWRSPGWICNSEACFCRKPAGLTCIFPSEIRRDCKRDDGGFRRL